MKLYGGAGDDDLTGTPRDDLLNGDDRAEETQNSPVAGVVG